MEIPDLSPARNSTSSALEIPPTFPQPGSSSPESRAHASFPRRRLSWSRAVNVEPLRLDTLPPKMATAGLEGDDPFYSPFHDSPIISPLERPDDRTNPYTIPQARQSTASLIPQPQFSESYGEGEDDEAGLTQNMAASGSSGPGDEYHDSERAGGMTPRRRRTARYNDTGSLKKTKTAIKSVSRSLHRASLRVVNLSNAALESQVRLEDDDESSEKALDILQQEQEHRWSDMPLRGRTLGIFGSNSRIRQALYRFLVYRWTERSILLLIIFNAIVLTMQSTCLFTSDNTINVSSGCTGRWEDFALFVTFIVYTLEAFARICVSGFLLDPEIRVFSIFSQSFYQTSEVTPVNTASISRQPSLSRNSGLSVTRLLHRISDILLRPFRLAPAASRHYPHQSLSTSGNGGPTIIPEKINILAHEAQSAFRDPAQPTYLSNLLKSDSDTLSLPFKLNINHIHDKIHRNIPYLRQSWCRIDFVAIVSFWIAFALATSGVERGTYHIGVFRAMSVIRCARLLAMTSGTTTIMHSLKMARPLLASTAYYVLFAMILFSIISVQAFHGSLRRTCLLQPTLGENVTQIGQQFCGGHINSTTLQPEGYIRADGTIVSAPKGYICPVGQLCTENQNPYENIESFDTIYNAALQVIVIASANTWAPLMYSTIDSEYFESSIFFIVCIVVLNFWLFNLFVAVITNTFDSIRTVTKKSAFGAAPLAPSVVDEQEDGYNGNRNATKKNVAYDIMDYTKWFWIFLALASLALQATRTANMSALQEAILYYGEGAITVAFDIEIVLRFVATLPDWRSFFRHGNNVFDLILALGSTIIQLPVIHSSSLYPWFTIFQLARFYRVILVVPHMKPLLLAVFGNLYGLFNMTLFLLMVNLLAALVAVQFLRGDLPGSLLMNFGNLYNSFLAMYQISSSENWTTVLYGAATAEVSLGQAVLVIIYVSFWLLFSFFIILQMFIAVLHENFSVAEEVKKKKQASNYWATHESSEAKPSWARKLNPYRWLKANPVTIKVDNLPSNLVLPMQKSLVQDYNRVPSPERSRTRETSKPGHYASRSISALQRLFVGKANAKDIPLQNLRHARNGTLSTLDDDGPDRHLALLASVGDEASNEDLNDILYERRARKADFIRVHPSYDKTFWIFSQKNPVRRMCQKLVQPAGGERIFGVQPSPVAHTIFQLVLLLTVIGIIAVEGVATPLYRRKYLADHPNVRLPWFGFTDAAFSLTFFFEFVIKGTADGYIFTPNAYVKSIWNVLDLFIMAGFVVNVTTGLIFVGDIRRLTKALRALPTLRLITLVDGMRYTFRSLLLTGVGRILDAAVLSVLYMIPYAVWGLNIFAGKMNQCNDGNATGLGDCTFEYTNNISGAFGYMVPRVWSKPSPSTTFSFDSFQDSLLILFEIVSLEGWIDVLGAATGITGLNLQPNQGFSPSNAIFFVIYNLMGGVVLLTIFVSIIIDNFSMQTGTAYLTAPQREWIDLQKLIKRQRPSKRPKVRPTNEFRSWCFDRAVQKHGWWSRAMTVLIVLHILALMTQPDGYSSVVDSIRTKFFLVFTAIYIVDVAVRFFGLGWSSFKANGWNLFDLFVSIGTFLTTLIVQAGNENSALQHLQKLFLVSIAFKLVQKTDSLNMLFKTSVASLPAILSLLGLWVIVFIFFAILNMEVFSMTKWGSAETRNQNYTSLGRAIVMLIFMSTGEGWNQYMHDFDLEYPRCTNLNASMSESDCGSTAWAFSLFIAWNLLSMYIFANLFTGVVVENFSYVFQSSAASTKSITREEMRAFKKVWAELADPKSGYLPPNQFGRFFTRLAGVFEVRIYPVKHSISNLLSSCQADGRSKLAVDGLDIRKLTKKLSKIDYASIRKRRAIYSRLYHEAQISHDGQGMTFTDMLMLLAHNKIIIDAEALVLKDFMVRSETNRLVTDLVNLDRVRSLLKMLAVRRKYLAERAQAKMADVPSIVVEVMPSTPPSSSRDISSAFYDFSPSSSAFGSPMTEHRYSTSELSFAVDGISRLQRSPRRSSDVSMLSTDLGARSPTISFIDDDPQAILASVQNSMWGEVMQEAAEEDERGA